MYGESTSVFGGQPVNASFNVQNAEM